MLIKPISYTAREPQRPSDASRLLRYLIAGEGGSCVASMLHRLAGPPFVRRMVQRVLPWDDPRRAAEDIAHQLFAIVRRGCPDAKLARQVYAHFVLSFAPRRRTRRASGAPEQSGALAPELTFTSALRIVLDALENIGVGEYLPLYLVFHRNRRHLHAHAVVGLFTYGTSRCCAHELNLMTIRAISKQVILAHDLAAASSILRRRHVNIVERFPYFAN
jgi:hypothetical protein